MSSEWSGWIFYRDGVNHLQRNLPIIPHNKRLQIEFSVYAGCRWLGFGLSHKLTDLDAISATFGKIHLGNSSPCVLSPDLFEECSGVLKVGKSTNLDAQNPNSLRPRGIAYHSKLDLICPVARHA
jgi:hypothetical protein